MPPRARGASFCSLYAFLLSMQIINRDCQPKVPARELAACVRISNYHGRFEKSALDVEHKLLVEFLLER